MSCFHTVICLFFFTFNTFSINAFLFRNLETKFHGYEPFSKLSKVTFGRNLPKIQNTNNLDPPSIQEQIESLDKNGIIHLPSVISSELVDTFHNYIQDQKILAWFAGFQVMEAQSNSSVAIINRTFYGDKQSDLSCDLQLSLLRSGYVADLDKNTSQMERHVLADVLEEMFDNMKDLSCELGLGDGYMKELSVFMTDPGYTPSKERYSDLSNYDDSNKLIPLYEMAVALEDITESMGPTTFFLTSHTVENRDSILSGDSDLPTYAPILKKGDAIVYDARIVKLDQPNDSMTGSLNTKFQLSFQNPKVDWNSMDYKGTIRPGYVDAILFSDLQTTILEYSNGDGDAFAKYGDGITKAFHDVESSSDTELILESKSEIET